ncbi:Metallo-dependent hydrolase [Xylona heveae TC161]|uniref:Probable guanine deaminase n=1 Tax=Xylona heveae (strain CBS 132557 / TC161) TaxID=1328760 RepID=A0A165FQC6_XYLHT|nr:Metallo-dependent hydrolase [Xylona heveae TC161]KZF21252.1 Metallo-dependent hydrolase [Xylona heveae TC161]
MTKPQGLHQTVYAGAFVHSTDLNELEICENGAIGVDEDGKIAFVERNVEDLNAVVEKHGWKSPVLVRAPDCGFFFPGFIDTHIHASQYPNAGIFGKSTLLDWLETYTFPLESSLSSRPKAKTVYTRCVQRTLSHGTTTAAYYATAHAGSTNLLSDVCLQLGQRAFIGRCNMDSLAPDWYKDSSASTAVDDTRETIAHIASIDPEHKLITPILTPRFAPSCSSELLTQLGKLHAETGLPCQTHISENIPELELVQKLFPQYSSYADVYDAHGLLTPGMVLAHAVYLTPKEQALIKARDAKISHCPASNSSLSSGCARVRTLLDQGITVGLGTDISGGYSPSVLEAARQAALVSRHVAMTDGDAAKLSVEEVLYLSTKGGARVMGLDAKVGSFDKGLEWDAQMISLGVVPEGGTMGNVDEGPVDIFGWESWDERVAKWVYNGDDRNTRAVWVRGHKVHQKP